MCVTAEDGGGAAVVPLGYSGHHHCYSTLWSNTNTDSMTSPPGPCVHARPQSDGLMFPNIFLILSPVFGPRVSKPGSSSRPLELGSSLGFFLFRGSFPLAQGSRVRARTALTQTGAELVYHAVKLRVLRDVRARGRVWVMGLGL